MTRTTGHYTDKIQCPRGAYNPVEKISTTHISQDSFTRLSIYQKSTTDL